jgi:hypothetical protein
MSEPCRSRRAYAWLSCRAKTCCGAGVAVTDADIARIATGLGVEPSDFVAPAPALAGDPAAVRLGPSGPVRLRIAVNEGGCVFLLRARSGAGRCGLGDLAPATCRVFPADVAAVEPSPRAETGCDCREWTAADLDRDELAGVLASARADLQRWHARVAHWNAYAARADPPPDLADLWRYLLHARTTAAGQGAS